jgi:hypothetical protein
MMIAERAPATADLDLVDRLAREIDALGRAVDLPYIAVSADISSPRPMVGRDGQPLAETLFRWLDPKLEYWRDRAFALRAPFVFATRLTSEPFYFQDGRLQTWRPTAWTQAMGAIGPEDMFGVRTAIVAPAYQPRGVIGAVVWASPDPDVDVAGSSRPGPRVPSAGPAPDRRLPGGGARRAQGHGAADPARDPVPEMGRGGQDRRRDRRHRPDRHADGALPHDQRRRQAGRGRSLPDRPPGRDPGLYRGGGGA